MSKNINRYGVRRSSLTESVKREVRRRSAFGCVICRQMPWHYAHVDPSFEDLTPEIGHDASRITLLCEAHHRQFDSKPRMISLDQVKERMRRVAEERPDSIYPSSLSGDRIILMVGGQMMHGSELRIEINGHRIFGVRVGDDGGPWQFSGCLYGLDGERVLKFENNEMCANSDKWDVDFRPPTLAVYRAKRDAILRMSFDADRRLITIDRLQTRLGHGHYLEVSAGRLALAGPQIRTIVGNPQQDKELGDFYEREMGVSRESMTGNVFNPGARHNLLQAAPSTGYVMCHFEGKDSSDPTILRLDHVALGTPSDWAKARVLKRPLIPPVGSGLFFENIRMVT